MIHEIEIGKPNLTPYQEEFLYNDARFTITEASTKIGKTFAHIWFIYEQAHKPHNKPNYNYWWVAPVYSQTKIAFNRMRAKIAPTGLYKVNESNLIITCPNGVHIHFKSAEKPDNLYGEDVYGIVFDEAPRARENAFFALRSTLTATGGWMKLIGNFGGTANWVHKLKQKANTDKEYKYFKVTAWDGVKYGVLNESEVLQAQKDLPPKIFKQLYLAEEQESKDQLISFTAMKNLFTNSFVERTGQMYISADIALHGSDKFIVLVWHGWVLIDYIEVDKTDAKQVEELLRDTATKHKVPHSNIIYDSDGLGAFLRGYLSTAIPFNNGGKPINNANYSNIKNQCGYELAKKINRNEVYIDCDIDQTELFKELECLQSYALDRDGKLQLMPKKEIKEIIGHSPDKLDAFIMRMYFDILPKAVYYV